MAYDFSVGDELSSEFTCLLAAGNDVNAIVISNDRCALLTLADRVGLVIKVQDFPEACRMPSAGS